MSLPRSADPGLLIVLLLFAFLALAALFINPVRTAYGIKSDEATYVTMALSLAHDGDLSFQERDLTRFWPIYERGPEGIFLKHGKGPDDRLYFGKAFIYPLVAAPFVRLAGLNGLLVLNILLLAGLFTCLYVYAAARATPSGALLLATGFLAASISPLFAVWMMPETFNLALVGYAYFCWLFKEVRPPEDETPRPRQGFLSGQRSDIAAAILLGLATFSKPSNLVLVLPLIALAWWRRDIWRGLQIGLVFALVVAAGFGVNGLVSGELNYQGGGRKTFYGEFPFQDDDATFDTLGISVTTENLEFEGLQHLGRNLLYFVVGRHFGLLPYYFPAIVVIVWALRRWRELEAWHALIAAAVTVTALTLLLLLPYTWSGGGGPPGNRYFLSIYPAFFFLIPPARSLLPGVIMWVGGGLFVAQILVDPFVAASRPWQNTQSGLFQMLPVELTMVNDLPLQLDRGRSRIPYRSNPQLLLYYLDDNAWRPEEPGFWVAGGAETDLIVQTAPPLSAVDITVRSPIENTASLRVDGTPYSIDLEPNRPVTIRAPVDGVIARGAQSFILTIETNEGFVPSLLNADSNDGRYLGVVVGLEGIVSHVAEPVP